MSKVLVTGARGFVGAAIVRRLAASGRPVRSAVRQASGPETDTVATGDIDDHTDWRDALQGIDAIVHAAARVHQGPARSARDEALSQRVNCDATLGLARQALHAGVRRFVFLSSIKVNGDRTEPGHPFRSGDAPAPTDAYGASKLAAERALSRLAEQGPMEVVVIRPPLVYGPGVRANFRAMLRWVASGVPLPFGSIDNHRSLIALDNLVDFVVSCVDHPAAPGRELLVSDGEDVSTTELLRIAARTLGRPARLLPVPAATLRVAARAVGRQDWVGRLCDSLQLDASEARARLGWTAPVRLESALKATALDYLASVGSRAPAPR